MDTLKVKKFGPIREARVDFGDLTLLVGPQASGKSIFVQLLKLIIDRDHIRRTLEQYNFVWGNKIKDVLDLYFGEGMHDVWTGKTEIEFDGKRIDDKKLLPRQNDRYREGNEKLFYIPAQRILSISDGRPKFFTEFDISVPYVLRHFSETLRQLLQNGLGKKDALFPLPRRLREPLRESFNDSIFHDGKVIIDNRSGQKKFRMQISDMSIPFMAWSAGQKEFMPLLLSFYWLCTSGSVARRDKVKYIVIEEPEMGLHPDAIKSVILQVVDLLSRDYKVVISTHSPVLLQFAWAYGLLQKSGASDDVLADLFELEKKASIKALFSKILNKKILKTYYFYHSDGGVECKDISSLDAGSEDKALAGWGGISAFGGRAIDLVSEHFPREE